MTSSNGEGQQRGGGLLNTLRSNPAVSQLGDAAKDYARARGGNAVRKVGDRLTGVTDNLQNKAEDGGFTGTAAATAIKKVAQGDNPVKAAVSGVGSGVAEKVKGMFGGGGGGGKQKVINIIEDIHIGVPVDVAYNQWTQFQEFSSFMKGVESVDQTDEVETNWKVKVFKSSRSWTAKVTEQIPDRRIAWTTEGDKGTTKGVVTFHPLADDLTQVLLVIEYYPKGFFEKTGNIWRAAGRRARLDLKHFRRFVMMSGEETGSWRGEIRDGEVVRGPDEEESADQQAQDTAEDRSEDESSEEPSEDEAGDEDEEYEDQAEDQEYEDEEAEEGAREPEPAGAR
ncbi:MAG TPA: SRPBCC family protein [Blastococcus sp.]|nr:SRPBCC family protein [Blastococcus sp.]